MSCLLLNHHCRMEKLDTDRYHFPRKRSLMARVNKWINFWNQCCCQRTQPSCMGVTGREDLITELVKTFSPWQRFCRLNVGGIFLNEIYWILIQISLKFVPEGSFDNKLALTEVMAWYQTGANPLPEPMTTQITDNAIWYQWATKSSWIII